ncbi:MAG: NAD(P)H-dependent oxidoreductase subunit E, partial [Clostridia bacterium]|nr:NAD(P)H-dependent oxidoreductase subunit E [Clostridia bacterium]
MEKTSTLPFKGTKEQEAKLMDVIAEHKGEKGAAIPVLHKAQEIYGYLPIEVQTMIAEGLDVPLAEIYGIVTFYT